MFCPSEREKPRASRGADQKSEFSAVTLAGKRIHTSVPDETRSYGNGGARPVLRASSCIGGGFDRSLCAIARAIVRGDRGGGHPHAGEIERCAGGHLCHHPGGHSPLRGEQRS